MATEDSRNERLLGQLGVTEQVVWTTIPHYAIPPSLRERLHHGPNWLDGKFSQLDATTDVAISLVASPSASRADYEVQGRIAITEALAAAKRVSDRKPTSTTDPSSAPEPGEQSAGEDTEDN